MINNNIWIKTLPASYLKSKEEKSYIDNDKWADTIPKINKGNSIKKYSFTSALFILVIIFVSLIKNQTRDLEKEISNLSASISTAKMDLHRAVLDYEVVTSPENISRLGKEYLESNLIPYKKSQIKNLGDDRKKKTKLKIENKENIMKEKIKEIPDEIKAHVAKKIKEKKVQIAKLQQLYSDPRSAKSEVAKKIEEVKQELQYIYENPETVQSTKVKRWVGFQFVKLFIGMPIVPGK